MASNLPKLERQIQPSSYTSASFSRDRLKSALIYDRCGLEQGGIDQVRDDLAVLLAEYLEISEEDIDLYIDDVVPSRLVASITLGLISKNRT